VGDRESGRTKHPKPRGTWKVLVRNEVHTLTAELNLAEQGVLSEEVSDQARFVSPEERARIVSSARSRLRVVTEAAGPTGLWSHLLNWLTGAAIEQAWPGLHAVEEDLLLIQEPEKVRAQIPDIRDTLQERLGTNDSRLNYLKELDTLYTSGGPVTRSLRETLRRMRHVANAASDEAYGRVRGFRNLLLGAVVVLAVALVTLALGSLRHPLLPICSPAPAVVGTSVACPALWRVELVGALGGLLSAIAAIRRLDGVRGPYGLPATQLAMKIPAGSLTGVLGALWLQGRVLGLVVTQPELQLLAYVALFGFAQEAFTAFVDRRAGEILGAARSRYDPAKS
jgi:hypothetical protein